MSAQRCQATFSIEGAVRFGVIRPLAFRWLSVGDIYSTPHLRLILKKESLRDDGFTVDRA